MEKRSTRSSPPPAVRARGLVRPKVGRLVVYGCRGRYWLVAGPVRTPCAIGRHGATWAKREGDGKTPRGVFPLVGWWARRESGVKPKGARLIRPDDGWCDDPVSGAYNTPVRLPTPFGHERMWRVDSKYHLVGVIGYNIRPRARDRGSAIFFHLSDDRLAGTAGCVAVAPRDMDKIVAVLRPNATLRILCDGAARGGSWRENRRSSSKTRRRARPQPE